MITRGFPRYDGKKFIDYYAAGDPPWHDAKGNPVKSWKQRFVSTWEVSAAQQSKPIDPLEEFASDEDEVREILREAGQ